MTGILFWNCRGARKPTSRGYLKELVRFHRPIAVILLETRIMNFTRREIDRLIGRDWCFNFVPSDGRSGGILLLWLDSIIKIEILDVNQQFILSKVRLPFGDSWNLGAIYANKDLHRRRTVWSEMAKLDCSTPTVLGGDFNCVLHEEEKRGGNDINSNLGPFEFANFISQNGLHEAPFTGNMFTWCNNQDINTRILSRLDRVLLNSAALLAFPGTNVKHLPRIGSDHSPLLLEIDNLSFKSPKSRLKFEDAWMQNPNTFSIAHSVWSRPICGNPSKVLDKKCERTIKAIARWSKFNAKDMAVRISEVSGIISNLQSTEQDRSLTEDELSSLRKHVAEYGEIQTKLETWWWQRSKANWLKHGDRNSKFFHSAATQRKHDNTIFGLTDGNDNPISEQLFIEEALYSHFSARWQLDDNTNASFPLPEPTCPVTEFECQRLLDPISDAEIRRAVFSFSPNRSPGWDGVTHSFFKNFWSFTVIETIAAVKEFFATGSMKKSWKDTLVMLIPKTSLANKPDQFRPISLCTSIYKIIAKIMSNRMKPLLPRLISEEQAAFVPGRLLSDNCILAQELFHRMHTTESKVGYMAIKIDMEKAFDRMQWSFVRRALAAFNFPSRWIDLILECISFPRFGLLVNGVRSKWIEASCGLRQGCPLSPYLFIICSEFLSKLIQLSSSMAPLGIKVCLSTPPISHLLFADDTLLFGAATVQTARKFSSILDMYCSMSGQAVNAGKSSILFGPKVPRDAKSQILLELGYNESDHFIYLGVKMRPGRILSSDYLPLVQQIGSQINTWGTRHLSLAGRIALINSTLTAIPQHVLSNAPVPISIINKINSLLKHFLWNGTQDGTSIHYATWEDVCSPKSDGGLGIKNLITWRKVIMCKVKARVLGTDNSLLARTFRLKYSGDTLFTMSRSCSKIWKLISLGDDIVKNSTFWKIGNGSCIKTLHDCWVGSLPFASWPTFVDINGLPEHVSDLLDQNGCWNVLIPQIFGPLLAARIMALPRLPSTTIDQLVWAHSENIRMVPASVYAEICTKPQLLGGWIWKLSAPPRTLSLFWRAINGLMPTNDWLSFHRLREDASCPWGCGAVESIDHIFGSCRFFNKIKAECHRMNLNLPLNSFNEIISSLSQEVTSNSRSITATIILSIMYNVWKARNDFVHMKSYMQPASIIINAISSIDPPHGTWRIAGNPSPSVWSSPPHGWIKINYDGAVRENCLAGLASIVRAGNGDFLAARGVISDSRSVYATELRSAAMGIELARQFFPSVLGIILEGDSSDVYATIARILDGIISNDLESSVARSLVNAPLLVLSLVRKSANRAADFISNIACLDNFDWSRGMPLPQELLNILSLDTPPPM